jgi:hypothetical protein
MKEEYQKILDSLKKDKCIDEEVYNVIMSSPADEIVSLKNVEQNLKRLDALAATGLTVDQEIRTQAAYLTLVMEDYSSVIFAELYKTVKEWFGNKMQEKKSGVK